MVCYIYTTHRHPTHTQSIHHRHTKIPPTRRCVMAVRLCVVCESKDLIANEDELVCMFRKADEGMARLRERRIRANREDPPVKQFMHSPPRNNAPSCSL